VSGLVFNGGYTLAERLEQRGKPMLKIVPPESVPDHPKIIVNGRQPNESGGPARSWAQEMFNFNGDNRDVTGSVGSESEGEGTGTGLKVSPKPPAQTHLQVGGAATPLKAADAQSAGERAVLERLQERRRELDKRNHDLDMRETLLKAAERRLDAKLGELRSIETKTEGAAGARAKAQAETFKSIVTMYETMKPKDAARIFDRLDLKILVEVSTQMNPRKMSEVLAQMSPEAAERLTVELARQASASGQSVPDQLPKIEGKRLN
jgi:flagellar motility protein MotE (MotC chaperone)